MTKLRVLLGLCFTLALLVIATIVVQRTRAPNATLGKLGNVSRVEVLLKGTTASLVKVDQWTLESFNGAPVKDKRANVGFVTHLIDLAASLNPSDHSPLDADSAAQYGIASPTLGLTMGWDKPERGDEAILFGNRDVTGKQVFAFFPKRKLLVPVRAQIMLLIEDKTALDLRDRRVTTFTPDDVEDLQTTAGCGGFVLARDGDRWAWKSGSQKDTDGWIAKLLSVSYESIDENVTEPSGKVICEVTLKGRKDRAETIKIIEASDGTIWATNTRLPAAYRLPTKSIDAVLPLKTARRKAS